MLKTPFGTVCILADGRRLDCEAEVHVFDKPMTRERPLAGCYRARIRVAGCREIRCVLMGCPVSGMDSSGEDYQAVEFVRERTQLTIGTRTDGPQMEVVPMTDGIVVNVLSDGAEVIFGIAWVEDCDGASDVRTWYAADPTLD